MAQAEHLTSGFQAVSRQWHRTQSHEPWHILGTLSPPARPADRSPGSAPRGDVTGSFVRLLQRPPGEPAGRYSRWQGRKIEDQHIPEPGLVVLDVTVADEDTLRAGPLPTASVPDLIWCQPVVR
ncbi:DUF6207 family protein [Streptomyces flaveolus]|uniref:DUF6207 family protein n=1 Tax=Streptomyces flaveolus TaxID=67297 RepID=UPI00369070CF